MRIINAAKIILSEKKYILLFILILPAIFLVFIIIPVLAIPGNDVLFQLSIFSLKDYAVLIVLAPLIALMFTMQTYIFRKNREMKERLRSVGSGAVGGYSGILATVFGTAACSSCVAVLFGFLGTGAVFFIVKYRWPFVALAVGLLMFSLYFASQKVLHVCENC